jgi:ribosomal protein L37AE/L43A
MAHKTKSRRRKPVDQDVPIVKCPKCERGQVNRGVNAIYWCDHCHAQFDGDPDEGGDWSDRNPAARLEREEKRLTRRA